MKIYLPLNLDLESTIKDYKKKHREKYEWIIHTILHMAYKTHKDVSGYVNLEQTLLRKYLGPRYTLTVLKQLQEAKIIEINPAYSVGAFSKSYRLTKKYSSSKITSREFKGGKAAIYLQKLNDYNKGKLAAQLNRPEIAQLHENVLKVDIDKQAALDYTNGLHKKGKIIEEQYSVAVMSIENISSKDENFFFTIHELTGRVYHSIANCPRYLRQFLSYKGERLVQLDIANCQPLLFYPMILEYLKNQGKLKAKVVKNNKMKNTVISPYVDTIDLRSVPKDVKLYGDMCKRGLFYTLLMLEFDQLEVERNKFKKDFFGQIFFSRMNTRWERAVAVKFKEAFPTVYKAVLWYKQNNHADLPLRLQKVESDIIIKGVCSRIVAENPLAKRPFFCTVHDSIVCLQSDAAYLKSLLDEELKTVMGFQPTVKVSPF